LNFPSSTGAGGGTIAASATIARAELRLHLRRRGFWLLLGLFAALVVAAGSLNRVRQVRERAEQQTFQQLVRAQWEGQPDRHPHRVSHYGTFAFKPPGPLAAFDPGVESFAGRVQYLEAHRQNAANFPAAGELSSAFRLGELSLAFVLQTVLPLIVIVLGCRTFVDEIESGRFRLLAGQGVSARTVALGKLLGLAAATAPFLLLGLGAALLAAVTDPAFRGDPDALARATLIAAALSLHTGAWLSLTVWISARARTAARACAALVSLWLLGSVLVPRLAAVVADARHPLPDKSSFTAAVAAATKQHGDSHDPNDPHFARFRAETLARYGVARVEDLPVNYSAVVMARGEELSAETFAEHFAALGATMEAQAALLDRAALVAPFLAVRALSSAAAGTDLRAQLQFQREAETYRYGFVQRLNELHRDEIRRENDKDQKIAAERWKQFPDFRARSLPLRAALAGTGLAWLALLLWAALPLAALARRKEWAA
jgi:ABC-2 type transport system permease protein